MSNRIVYIVGSSMLQNELLASFLQRETSATCLLAPTIETIAERKDDRFDPPHKYLIDCKGKKAEGLFLEFETDKELLKQHFVSLFNVATRGELEEEAVLRGIRGIFYEDTPLEYFSNRRLERFGLELPAKVEIIQPNTEEKKLIEILTGNVSAGGAFFYTENPLVAGTRVKIDLALPLDKLRKIRKEGLSAGQWRGVASRRKRYGSLLRQKLQNHPPLIFVNTNKCLASTFLFADLFSIQWLMRLRSRTRPANPLTRSQTAPRRGTASCFHPN